MKTSFLLARKPVLLTKFAFACPVISFGILVQHEFVFENLDMGDVNPVGPQVRDKFFQDKQQTHQTNSELGPSHPMPPNFVSQCQNNELCTASITACKPHGSGQCAVHVLHGINQLYSNSNEVHGNCGGWINFPLPPPSLLP